MNQRTMDEMISSFNQEVIKMDIKHEDKIKLLGMITAIGYKSKKQERKTGRWEYVDYGGFGNWHCTACRNIAIVNGNENYCPNCGAKMEVEHERHDIPR